MKNPIALALVVLATLLAGCVRCKPGKAGPPGKYTIELNLDESLKAASVVVDLVGVGPASLGRWEAYDMQKYWRKEDDMRRDADKIVFDFSAGNELKKTLAVTDDCWQKWKS